MAWGQPTTLLDKSTKAVIFLEAQLLCYEIDVTDSLTHGRLAFFRPYLLYLWIDLDVLYSFAT